MKNPATLAAGAIVAALALFSALAPAQAETLVSNIGQTAATTTSKLPSQNELAQGFRAGSHAALSSIAIKFGGSFGGGAAPTMTLHSGDPNSTAIATLSGPGWIGNGTSNYTYTDPAGTVLAASTNYFVVIKGGGEFVVSKDTASNSEDSGGESGWSVADDSSLRALGGTGAFTQIGGTYPSFMIRVDGVVNHPPAFRVDTIGRRFNETVGSEPATASLIDGAIEAEDSAGDTLTYALSGADAAKFDIDATTGQLYTKDGEKYDRETKATYLVTVTATDSAGQSDTVEVLMLVGNEDEPPLKPGTPVVTQSPINSADLVVTWTAPDNEGRPPITDYLITYSLAIGDLGAATVRTSELTATLTNLERLTRYQIGVRATNAEGQGESSSAVDGTTGLGGRCVTPTLPGRTALYRATLTAREYSRTYSGIGKEVYGYGFLDSVGALSARAFTSSSTDYEIKGAFLFDGFAAGQFAFLGYAADTMVLTLDRPLSEDDKDELRLHVCGTTFNFSDSIRRDYGPTEVDYVWQSSGLDWSAVAPRFLYISRSASGTSMPPRDETVTPRSPPENALIASFSRVPAEHDGASQFFVNFHLSEEPDGLSYRTVHNGLFDVTGGMIAKAKRLTRGNNNGWHLDIVPDDAGDVTLQVKDTTACDTAPGVCTADGRKLAGGLQVAIAGPAVLSIADAEVEEAEGAQLDFVVTLSKSRYTATTVAYATSDGTATAGADYTETSGTITFAALETTQTVSVAVLDDSHDEGSETMTLTLSNPSGAVIDDGEATGTINNTDAMPRAWLIRFGRTVGSQVVDALTQRLDGAGASHVTVAGINVIGAPGLEPEVEDDHPFGLPEWAKNAEREADAQALTADDLLLRSAFHLSSASDGAQGEGPAFTAWGRVSSGGFEAVEKHVTMSGDVTTGLVGFDAEWERTLAGIMFSQSSGDGSYRLDPELGDDAGTVESSLTGVYPYASLDLSTRVSAWALAGVGSGELMLKREGHRDMPTDISMRMGAVGVKGQVIDSSGPSGVGLNVKSDAMWVGTKSERSAEMVGTEGDVTRLRLIVQGERVFEAGNGATFTPSAEVGLRHDGGDAETGSGVEVGAGLRYTAGPLTIEAEGRTLVAHEASGYEEWGMSAAIRVTPSPSGRGLTLSIAPAWGHTGSATNRLWSAHDARALGADSEFEATGRLEMDTGYGFGLPGNRGVLTPYAGLTLGEAGDRTLRTGTRWQLSPDTVVGLKATRQTSDAGETDNQLILRIALRF